MSQTIDVDSFVEKALATWIAWASFTIETWIFTAAPWLDVWGVRDAVKWVIKWAVKRYSVKTEKRAFFFNTRVRAADQAKDFELKAIAVDNLPEDVNDADWEKAEREKLVAFELFMSLVK